MNLSAEEWARVEELLPDLLALAPARRQRQLERECGSQPRVRRELEALIAASEADGGWLDRPVGISPRDNTRQSLACGEHLDAWRIDMLVGCGGMGEVYAATRADGAYDQRVALKLLKRGIDTQDVLKRFLRERRILAKLSHPNIARLLDAGSAPDGRPYLVMEYVDGLPIDQWVDSRAPALEPRLLLMCEVCEAVFAAHRQQIVHRDLKPSNVLVTAAGEVKLLDFGVSKLVGEDGGEETQTVLGGTPVTPDYAAPEQLLGQPITAAADVYALGLILYRLLTGGLPHSRPNLAAAWSAAGKDAAITRPSAMLLSRRAGPTAAPRREQARALEGDLDQIVLKALQRDPGRRYASAAALADDVRRHLEHRPVLARPDSRWYVARRFFTRNRVPVVAGAAVVLALVVGLGAALSQARRADARAMQLAQVAAFQGAMLRRVNVAQVGALWLDRVRQRIAAKLDTEHPLPAAEADAALATYDRLRAWAKPSEVARETLAQALLDPARDEIARRFAEDPLVEASLRASLGEAYEDFGAFDEAIRQLRRAVALRSATQGAEHADTLAARLLLARMESKSDATATAQADAQAVVDARRRTLGADHRLTLAAQSLLAEVMTRQGDYEHARALAESVLAAQRHAFGAGDADTLATELQLARTLSSQGHAEDARPLAGEVLAERRRTLGNDDPATLSTMDELMFELIQRGQNQAARSLGEEQLAARRRVLGDDHPDTLKSLSNLAVAVENLGDAQTGFRLKKEAYDGYRRVLGEEHPQTLYAAVNYAANLRDSGNFAAARPIFERVVAVRRRVRGAEHPETLNAMYDLALTMAGEKHYDAALSLHRQVLEAERRVLGADHPRTLDTWMTLGETLLESGQAAAALLESDGVRQAMIRIDGPASVGAFAATRDIAMEKLKLGDADAALAMLQALLPVEQRALGELYPDVLTTQENLAEVLHRLHHDGEAQKLAGATLGSWRQLDALSTDVIRAERALADYDEALNQRREAGALRQQAERDERRLHEQWARPDAAAG